ncbi:MAG: carbamate kinase [Candidatus Riflebacteria bacterium]|nr:carbamate kinase [Candidatus Riflebacteria bacterium]
MANQKKLAIIAIGGNSLIVDKGHQSVPDQYAAVEQTCTHIAGLVKRGYRVVITHGNGPQVGFILRRSELSRHELHDVPMDSCGADTQGAIGYQIQQAMMNITRDWEQRPLTATIVTQVLVDRDDPSFQKPSKPIGSFMDKETADDRKAKDKWDIVEDAGRGFRRVVASPIPKKILELDAIKRLLESDVVVVAVGGGGIPVVQDETGKVTGVAAVIDKDLATSLLARDLEADVFIISTAVDQVCLNFNKPNQQTLDRLTLAEAKKYMAEGHFAAGSMKPKIGAVIEFLESGGKQALITDPAHLVEALEGKAGTWIVA